MLKIVLAAELNGNIKIEKYITSFPYSVYGENNDGGDVWWNLNSIECENLKGSFRLTYCNKIDFSVGNTSTTNGSKIESEHDDAKITKDHQAVPYFLFSQRQLLYINEKDVSTTLGGEKKKLSRFLIKSEVKAKESIQFFMTYTSGTTRAKKISTERLVIYLNLFENE